MDSSDRRSKRLFSGLNPPPELQPVVRQFDKAIDELLAAVPPGPNRTEALESLLDAKDHALRAYVSVPTGKKWDPLACRLVDKATKPGPAIMPRTTGA